MKINAFKFWVTALAVFVIAEYGQADVSHARSLEEIRQTKEIRICIAYPYEPFVKLESPEDCREDCKFSGIFYEESIEFAKSLGDGIQPKFLRVDWDEQFFNKEGKTVIEDSYTPELLASGLCDVYPNNLTKTDWREKKMDIVTLHPSRMMVIVHKSRKKEFKTPADLAGKTVLVEKDTSYQTWMEEQNRTVYAGNPVKIEFMLETPARKAVNAGRDAFLLTDADVAIWGTRNDIKDSVVVFPVGPTEEIGWGFRKNDKDLQAAAQKFFDAQRGNPESVLNTIWKNYFGRSLTEFIALMLSIK
jgi:membrane-bound lytic murein transglycosylase MltF